MSSNGFLGSNDLSHRPGPEFRLLTAMLRAAVVDACNDRPRSGRGRQDVMTDTVAVYRRSKLRGCSVEARQWIADRGVAEWSFEWVCEHLGLDAESVRRNIAKIIKSGIYHQEQFRAKDQMMDRLAVRLYEEAA